MSETLENLSREDRRFPPSPEFTADAVATEDLYREAADDREAFWADQGRRLDWAQEWKEVLDWSEAPFAKWFVSGTLNVAYNCVDRHVAAATATGSRSTSRVSPATPGRSRTRT